MRRICCSRTERAARSSRSGRSRHSERGDTLIEVLLAIVILGMTSVALLLAFGTSISGSAQHRSMATADTVLRTAAEDTISLIQQQSSTQWGTCPANYSTQPSATTSVLATVNAAIANTGYTMQMPAADPVLYWNGSSFSSSACVTSTAISPQVNSPQIVTITVTSPTGVMSSPLSFAVDDPVDRAQPTQGAATHLAFFAAPSNSTTTAGVPFATQPIVELKDANNITVTNALPYIQLSITPGTGPAGAVLTGCTATNRVDQVEFSGCSINEAGTYSLTATDTALSSPVATSTPTFMTFTVTAAAATQIAFSTVPPGPGVAGSAIPNVAVQVEDTFGNVVTSATGSVSISIPTGNGSPQTSFNSTSTTVALSGGVATFSNLVVDTSGTYTFAAAPVNISGVTTGISAVVTVTPGPTTVFVVGNLGSQTAGISFSDTITATDAYGNVESGYSYSGALAFSGPLTSPSGAAPTYPASVTFNAGVATPSGITLFDAQSSTTLTISQGSISGTSPAFKVGFGSASLFSVVTPGTAQAGTSISVGLTATDSYGNTVTTYTGAKTISFSGPSSSPSGIAPSYPTAATSLTFAAGAATSSPITLYDSQSTRLTASQTTGTATVAGTSGTLTVAPAGVSRLAFNPLVPGPASVATVIPNVVVQVVDTYGNVVPTATGTVAIAIKTSTSTQNTFTSGTTPMSVSGGVATFSNLVINTAGTYTLTASSGNISGVTAAAVSNNLIVGKVTPSNVVSNSSPTTVGSSITFTAALAGPTGGTTPTGTVSWSVSGTAGITGCTTATTTLSAGTATCTITASSVGTYIVTDAYGSDVNYNAATSAADTVSVAFTPNLLQIESKNGGATGVIQSGDYVGVAFPVPISPASVCAGQSATIFSISGKVTVTSNAAPITGNDELTFTPNSGQCTGNVAGFASGGSSPQGGYIDLGSKNFVTGAAENYTTSTLRFDGNTNNVQITLGGSVTAQGTVTTATTATYFPDSAILSTTGVAASGSASSSSTFTVLQPTAAAIVSGPTTPFGIPDPGDTIAYTYSEQMDANSILSGWSGASINVEACFTRASSGASTAVAIYTTSGCSTAVNLGSVNLGEGTPHYIVNGTTVGVTATMSMATVSNESVVTVTLTATSSNFTSNNNNSVWTWTPSASAADLAGNGLSTSVSPVSTSKVNFAPEQPVIDTIAAFRNAPKSIALLEQLLDAAWVI
jgi:type II secretory pathway pseudopilin PulG